MRMRAHEASSPPRRRRDAAPAVRPSASVPTTPASSAADLLHGVSAYAFPVALAHELAQPLAAILLNIDVAREAAHGSPDPRHWQQFQVLLEDIAHDAMQAADLLEGLRAVFLGRPLTRHAVDVNLVSRQAGAAMARTMTLCGVTTEMNLAAGLPLVCGHASLLGHVVINLLQNGLQAMDATPVPQRQLALRTAVRDAMVELQVSDTGTGIPDQVNSRLFHDRVTTKPDGLGMGLCLAHQIVAAHAGTLEVRETSSVGTTISVRLPMMVR